MNECTFYLLILQADEPERSTSARISLNGEDENQDSIIENTY